jgi:uncharacterized membrane protein YgcG
VSDHHTRPHFDEAFWLAVHRRAERVREFALAEIEEAERKVFSEAADVTEIAAAAEHNVVPVFTEPFWEEVETRARRVRTLAAESLVAAEDQLLGDEEVAVTSIADRRVRAGSGFRNLGRTLNLQRSDAFGFVAALLAAILLVPQVIAPVWSNAGVDPPKILKFMLIGDKYRVEDQASDRESEDGSIDSGQSSGGSSDGGTAAEGASSGGGSAAESGADGTSPNGEGGTVGTAGEGTPGPGQSGATGAAVAATPSPASSPTPAPPPPATPAAPLEVHAIAVSPSAIQVTWTDASADEIAFQVDRRVPDGAPPSIQRVGKDVTSFLWTNLAPESRACFRVRSLGEAGRSEWAPAAAPGYACATTPAAPAEPPGESTGGPPAPQPQAPPSPAAPPA